MPFGIGFYQISRGLFHCIQLNGQNTYWEFKDCKGALSVKKAS